MYPNQVVKPYGGSMAFAPTQAVAALKVKVAPAALSIDEGVVNAEFKSPQTGSVYTVVLDNGAVKVCYRNIGDRFRVRVQGDYETLVEVKELLVAKDVWSAIGAQTGGDDHISIVIAVDELQDALIDATQAVIKSIYA